MAVAATLACAVFLWLRGGELASSVMPQQQRRLQAAHPPAGACARAVPAAAAAAVARAVAAGAAPLEEVEAKVVEEQCSAAFRAEAAEDGKKGNGPRAFKWACPSIDTVRHEAAAVEACARGHMAHMPAPIARRRRPLTALPWPPPCCSATATL